MAELTMKMMLLNGLVDTLRKATIDDVSTLKATTVRLGKLQDNPTTGTGINLLVWPTLDDTDEEAIYDQDGYKDWRAPAYEIGGGDTHMMKAYIQMLFHFRGYQLTEGRIQAMEEAHTILSRARTAISKMRMPTHPDTLLPKDDFGEVAIEIKVRKWYLRESGGTGNYIYKGIIYVELMTMQNYNEE